MRTPMVVANWKMYKTVAEAAGFVGSFSRVAAKISGVEIVVCPPFVSLADCCRQTQGTGLILGAQNAHWEKEGAYTGEISPLMLRDLGIKYVILGHSERRSIFGEDNPVVRKKVEAALMYGLTPILCIGENLEQFKKGETNTVLKEQLFSALSDLPPQYDSLRAKMVIAYEPVWAIGTGTPATGEAASETIGFVRGLLRELWGGVSEDVRILYGGSVNPANILEFTAKDHIDGALIGGSSLQENNLTEMAQTVSRSRNS